MLRKTFWFLFEKDSGFTVRRAVMAKARPHVATAGVKGPTSGMSASASAGIGGPGDGLLRRNGVVGSSPRPSIENINTLNSSSAPSNSLVRGALPQPGKEGGKAGSDESDDAYKFLLHHIDSEIAALRRRVTTVAKQRESIEETQSRRIRDLFECIERPWLLLGSIPPPQLPNKALDVFAKEFYTRQNGTSTSGWEKDAIFLSTCRRNWRVLTTLQRKPYEIAARRNEQTRKELKKKMNNGCQYFEKMCEQTKEWTAEMVRDEMRKAVAAKTRSPPPMTSKGKTGSVAAKPVGRGQAKGRAAPKNPRSTRAADKNVEVLKFDPVPPKNPKVGAGGGARGRPAKQKTAKGTSPIAAARGRKTPARRGAKKLAKTKKK